MPDDADVSRRVVAALLFLSHASDERAEVPTDLV